MAGLLNERYPLGNLSEDSAMFSVLSQHLTPSHDLMSTCLDKFLAERILPHLNMLREAHFVFSDGENYMAMQVSLAQIGFSVVFHFGDARGEARLAYGVIEMVWCRQQWAFVAASLRGNSADLDRALLALDPYAELPLVIVDVPDAEAA